MATSVLTSKTFWPANFPSLAFLWARVSLKFKRDVTTAGTKTGKVSSYVNVGCCYASWWACSLVWPSAGLVSRQRQVRAPAGKNVFCEKQENTWQEAPSQHSGCYCSKIPTKEISWVSLSTHPTCDWMVGQAQGSQNMAAWRNLFMENGLFYG